MNYSQAPKKSWIFTSATIAIGEDFSHFKDRIGLPGSMEASFPSPFAVDENALIYLPKDLPEPSNIKFTEKMLEATQPLLKVVSGGVFFLFTSHSALNKAKDWFNSKTEITKR